MVWLKLHFLMLFPAGHCVIIILGVNTFMCKCRNTYWASQFKIVWEGDNRALDWDSAHLASVWSCLTHLSGSGQIISLWFILFMFEINWGKLLFETDNAYLFPQTIQSEYIPSSSTLPHCLALLYFWQFSFITKTKFLSPSPRKKALWFSYALDPTVTGNSRCTNTMAVTVTLISF